MRRRLGYRRLVARAAAALALFSILGLPAASQSPGTATQAAPLAGARLGVDWVPLPTNPIVTADRCFSWRCADVGDPMIERRPSGVVDIGFTTMGLRFGLSGLVADDPWLGHAVLASEHQAAGVQPERPVLDVGGEGTWDRYVETPSLLRGQPGPARLAAYMGYAARGGPTGFVAPALGVMTSEDEAGLRWKRSGQPIYRPTARAWDGVLVTGPAPVRGPDGTWRIYYTGVGTKVGVGLLVSRDGVRWEPYAHNPVLAAEPGTWDGQIIEVSVVYTQGLYWMWYWGYKGPLTPETTIAIGLAQSQDGIRWTRHAANPVLRPGPPGAWNDLRVLAPDVLVEPDGSLLMAAYGSARRDIGKTQGSIGLWRSGR